MILRASMLAVRLTMDRTADVPGEDPPLTHLDPIVTPLRRATNIRTTSVIWRASWWPSGSRVTKKSRSAVRSRCSNAGQLRAAQAEVRAGEHLQLDAEPGSLVGCDGAVLSGLESSTSSTSISIPIDARPKRLPRSRPAPGRPTHRCCTWPARPCRAVPASRQGTTGQESMSGGRDVTPGWAAGACYGGPAVKWVP